MVWQTYQNEYAKKWTDYLRPNPGNANLCNIKGNKCDTYVSAYDEKRCATGDCCPSRVIYGKGAEYSSPGLGPDRYNPIHEGNTYIDNPIYPLKSCTKQTGGVLTVTLNDLMPWNTKATAGYFS